jgi:hypothetical protein
MRRPYPLLAALLMSLILAAPAQAATVHRTFTAKVGSGGSSGTAAITAYTDGSGYLVYDLRKLRKGATYKVEIRNGKCGKLGSVVTRLAKFKASSTGRMTTSRALSVDKMFTIWEANWSHRLAIRFVSGSSVRCGNLNFPHATRVKMTKQGVLDHGIDLAVVRSPKGYPLCNVAMYQPALSQPTEPGVSFVFAHARKGMFLPLLNQWLKNRGADLIGLQVSVYTSDNMKYTYTIDKAWKSKTLDGAFKTTEKLWLQTSTGPNYTYPKLFLEATRVSGVAVSYDEAHPAVRKVKCG